MNDRLIIDRYAGVALGGAVGDALGAGYEFQDKPGPPIDMIGGGPFCVAPGEWTDDTAMANAIRQVVATGAVDLEAIAAGFLEWYAGHPKDVGNAPGLTDARHVDEVVSLCRMGTAWASAPPMRWPR